MDKKKTIIKISLIVVGLFIFTTIVPSLLSAKNDLAVLLGTLICIISCIMVYFNFSSIVEWFKNN